MFHWKGKFILTLALIYVILKHFPQASFGYKKGDDFKFYFMFLVMHPQFYNTYLHEIFKKHFQY